MATRWGILSAGKICHDFVTAIRSMPPGDHEVVAVAARKLEDAQGFAKLHGIQKAYGSYEELSEDKNIEVVYVGTLNSFHLPMGKLLLENGKHVLLEKPLCMNLREVKQLTKLAKEKNLFLMEAIWSRYLPAYEHMMKEISAGTIGDVTNVNVNFGVKISEIERLTKKALGGGSILDIGIYCLNAVCMAYSHETPEKIVAVGHLNEEGVDESVAACLKFKNGRLATINTSIRVNLPCEAVITGTKGSIKIPFPMWCADKVIVNDSTVEFPMPSTVLPCNFTNSSGLRFEANEVRRCLKEGLIESPRLNHSHSELLASIMDEIRHQIGVVYPADQ